MINRVFGHQYPEDDCSSPRVQRAKQSQHPAWCRQRIQFPMGPDEFRKRYNKCLKNRHEGPRAYAFNRARIIDACADEIIVDLYYIASGAWPSSDLRDQIIAPLDGEIVEDDPQYNLSMFERHNVCDCGDTTTANCPYTRDEKRKFKHTFRDKLDREFYEMDARL